MQDGGSPESSCLPLESSRMWGERPHQHKCEGKKWGCQVPQPKYWITGSKLKRLQAGLSCKCLRTLDVLFACFANLLCAKHSLTPLGHKTQVWESCYTLFWGHIFSNVADVEKQVVTSRKETCDQSEAWDGALIHVSLCPAGRNSVSVWSACERLQRKHQTGGLRPTAPHGDVLLRASMIETRSLMRLLWCGHFETGDILTQLF